MCHYNLSRRNKVRETANNVGVAKSPAVNFTYLWSNITKFSPQGRKSGVY